MAFKFPFTNYHELNLTWVLDQLKKLFEESAENVTVIENYNGRLTAVETELPLVSETAQGASQSAAAAASLAQQAKSTADTAQENAMQAQGAAGQARQEAQAAQSAADAATQAAQQAQATAQNFDGRITQAENDAAAALEASRSFENRVQAAINTANNAAQTATNAQGIAVNANQNAARALDAAQAADRKAEAAQDTANQNAGNIGNLSDLTTEAKQNLVAAINEAAQTGSGGDSSNCAPLIINTASGAMASFNDGASNMKIKNLVCTIEPVQEGTGEPAPSNIRPIMGHTNINIIKTGANLLDPESKNITETAVYFLQNSPIKLFSNISYTLTLFNTVSNPNGLYAIRADGAPGVNRYDTNTLTVTPTEDGLYYFRGLWNQGQAASDFENTIACLTIGTSGAQSYISYNGSTLNVSWENEAGIVYRGFLDVISGKLTVTMSAVDLGSFTWREDNKRYNTLTPLADAKRSNHADCLCPIYKADNGAANRTVDNAICFANNGYIYIYDTAFAGNGTDFKNYLSGIMLYYGLQNPIEYNITSRDVFTLYGQNNMWTDVRTIQSCNYPADTKMYIDGKLAELQATILENI